MEGHPSIARCTTASDAWRHHAVAHLTPATRGATTWTMKAVEGARTFNVVFATSYRSDNRDA